MSDSENLEDVPETEETQEEMQEERQEDESSPEDMDFLEVDPAALIEALLFAHGDPVNKQKLRTATGLSPESFDQALIDLEARLSEIESGVEMVVVADKYQLRTKNEFASYIQRMKTSRPRRLTPAALETLAIVAYRQPIVKSDVEKIRGVDATPTLKTLLERGVIRIVGHKDAVGQPALYGTTEEFLKIFGLGSLAELPTLRDLKELEEDPGESEELEAAREGETEVNETETDEEDSEQPKDEGVEPEVSQAVAG